MYVYTSTYANIPRRNINKYCKINVFSFFLFLHLLIKKNNGKLANGRQKFAEQNKFNTLSGLILMKHKR